MANTKEGLGFAGWRRYEDYTTLKRYINANLGRLYDSHYTNEILLHGVQTTTGSSVELLSQENTAVSYIGKTELTLVGACSADDNAYIGMVVTLVYKSNDGIEHTATCSLAADSSAEADFLDTAGVAITDYYCTVSASSSVVLNAAESFSAGATGALGSINFGFEIAAETTAATDATMGGVGNIYCRSTTEHDNADETVNYLDYMTPWGEVKRDATSTLTTTSVDEIRFIESDGTTYVKDFFIPLWFGTDTATTAGSDERLMTDSACSNVNGGGGDVYGCINQLTTSGCFSRMTTPEDGIADAWLGYVRFFAFQTNALADGYICQITFTPKGSTIEKTMTVQFSGCVTCELAIPLAPDTDVTMKVEDTVAETEFMFHVGYIVAKRM